jgi:hypothetical protein
MSVHRARLCWNENGWTRPSGVAHLAEGPNRGSEHTFASEHHYGHEEWLFRPEHTINGWRYGFLQPSLSKQARNLYGEEITVAMYTIDPHKDRWYLGVINGLVVLNEAEAIIAHAEFAHRGWLESMWDELSDYNLLPANRQTSAGTREESSVNVKYKVNQVHMLPEAIEAPPGDPTRQQGNNRYIFYPLDALPDLVATVPADPSQPLGAYTRYVTV